ncbi:MAG TPA: hypothetical protein PKK26_06395, partial [Candidatus Wallbacteria bacterium]|nr:hypothetical protein [Candidatus Wallbacteria bacterium]
DENKSFNELMDHEEQAGGKDGEPAEEHESHLYFGQNPWHNPDTEKKLKNSIVFYFLLFLMFGAFRITSRVLKSAKKN